MRQRVHIVQVLWNPRSSAPCNYPKLENPSLPVSGLMKPLWIRILRQAKLVLLQEWVCLRDDQRIHDVQDALALVAAFILKPNVSSSSLGEREETPMWQRTSSQTQLFSYACG